MAVRPILRLGHPRAAPNGGAGDGIRYAGLRELVHDMLDTMRANNGAGLAAIQIGVLQRVVVFELEQIRAIPMPSPCR